MSNKFNQFGSSGDSNVTNGSLDIYGYSLRAENLNPNEPLKTNSIGQLISSNLNISDVNNLQTELDATIQTPYTDGNIEITNGNLIAKDIVTDTVLSLNTSISNLESNVSTKVNKSGDTMSGNLDMGGNSMTNVFSIAVDEINEKTLGNGIYTIDTLYTTDVIVTGGSKIKTDNLEEATQNDGINILSTLHMNDGTIDQVNELKCDSIDSKLGSLSVSFPSNLNAPDVICDVIREKTLLGGVTCKNNLDMFDKNITNVNTVSTDNIAEATGANGIDVLSDIHMNSKTIDQVFDVRSDRVTCGQFQELTPGNGINIQNTEVYAINDTNPLVTNHFSIIDNFGNNANLRIISQSAVSSLVQEPTNFTIASNQNINILSGGAKDVTIGTSDGAKTILIDDSLGEVILNSLNLDMNDNTIQRCLSVDTRELKNTDDLDITLVANLDFQNLYTLKNISDINGIRPSGGLYSQSNLTQFNQTTETNMLGGVNFGGSLTIPANVFKLLSVYSFKSSGVLTGGTNDLFTLRLKSGSAVFAELPVTIGDNALNNVWWDLTADFSINTLGVAGVAVLVTSVVFRYINNTGVVSTRAVSNINNTTFDTTISNTLAFTFQNDVVNPLTFLQMNASSFTQWY